MISFVKINMVIDRFFIVLQETKKTDNYFGILKNCKQKKKESIKCCMYNLLIFHKLHKIKYLRKKSIKANISIHLKSRLMKMIPCLSTVPYRTQSESYFGPFLFLPLLTPSCPFFLPPSYPSHIFQRFNKT